MALQNLDLDAITETDIQRLVADREEERKTIDYKNALPGKTDGARKEFLADVVSFANTAGGDLVYGVREEESVAVEVCGFSGLNGDAEIRALEESILKGIAPRIPGVASRAIGLSSGRQVLIVRVPSSWAAPHLVAFQESSRFYARTSKGKYLMDVFEIRAAFAASETLTERLQRFRKDRLAAITADEIPALLREKARIVLQVIPFSALRPGNRVDLAKHRQQLQLLLRPLAPDHASWSNRFNFDGLVAVCTGTEVGPFSYVQLHRDGSIEAVETLLLKVGACESGQLRLFGGDLVRMLTDGLARYLSILRLLGCQPPVVVIVSLIGVEGYCMAGSFDPMSLLAPSVGIDRPNLLLPEILVENFDEPATMVLQPAFDAIWNACGHAAAPTSQPG